MKRPDGLIEIHQGPHTGWFDPARISTLSVEVFDPDYWRQRGAITGTASGRGTTWFVLDGERQRVLRHYRRGGLFGKLVRDSYLGWRVARSRAMAEFLLLQQMSDQGLPVPAPVAAHHVRRGLRYQADILIENIAGARSLAAVLADQPLTASIWGHIGATVRRFHDAGIDHTDLNIHNILLEPSGVAWLIDFDKCAQRRDGAWKQGNLDRLLRSLRKERGKQDNLQWCEQDWDHFMSGYR